MIKTFSHSPIGMGVSPSTRMVVPNNYRMHQNRFETQVLGHKNQPKQDVVTYDGKIDWSLRFYHQQQQNNFNSNGYAVTTARPNLLNGGMTTFLR
jgi:hypothetical protein